MSHFTTIPSTHTVDSTMTGGVFVARRLGPFFTFTVTQAIARVFIEQFWTDPDHISLQQAWDVMLDSVDDADAMYGKVTRLYQQATR